LNSSNEIVITGILEGGIIYRNGGIYINDILVSVNGKELNGKHFTQSQNILESVMNDKKSSFMELTIKRYDIDEELDEEITCL
jgi:C-terminal processing protease CtpA/Prc